MIQLKEFRTGNVMNDGIDDWFIVREFDFNFIRGNEDDYFPELLTAKWVNIFSLKEPYNDILWNDKYKFCLRNSKKRGFLFQMDKTFIPLTYVHQLQNLYFSLTGLELVFNDSNEADA
jgi:hypothetical protein